jgi:glutamate-1-semialdehyde 2,1-aminomutase
MLFERSLKKVPGGVHSPVRSFRGVERGPIFFEKAFGACMESVDGKTYIDFCMSFGPLLFGHRDPNVLAAIGVGLSKGWSYGTPEPYSVEVAEFICEKLPWIEKIRFVNSGTEAVMTALRISKAATHRHLVVKFDGCYHGHVDSMLVKAGSGCAQLGQPDSAGISPLIASETLVCELGDAEALDALFKAYPGKIAAIIIEPLPANNGLLIQDPGFLQTVCDLARKAGSLVIFDEVITGFRVALGGMAEQLGIFPDLTTYGKILGGGFPVAAVAGKAQFMDLLAPQGPVYQAGTLSANPAGMHAAMCMVGMCHTLNPYPVLAERTAHMAQILNTYAKQKKIAARVIYQDSLFWFVFGKVTKPLNSIKNIPLDHARSFSVFFDVLLDHGIYFPPSSFEVGFLSTAHTQQHLNALIVAAKAGFDAIGVRV